MASPDTDDDSPSAAPLNMVSDAVNKTTKLIKSSSMHVAAWFSGAALFGWYGHNEWHNSEDVECFYNHTAYYRNYGGPGNPFFVLPDTLAPDATAAPTAAPTVLEATRPEDCFESIATLNYMPLAVAIFLGLMLFYGWQMNRGVRGPLKRATWDLVEWKDDKIRHAMAWKRSEICNPQKMTSEYENHIRYVAEFFHMIFAIGMYIVWYMVVENDTTGVRVGSELPYLRHLFFLWLIVAPTVATCFTRQRIKDGLKATKADGKASNADINKAHEAFVNDSDYDIVSLAYKALIYLVLALFVDPQTQIIYAHSDDSQGQKNVIIAVTSVLAFFVLYFWMSYHNAHVEKSSEPHDSLFAFNDFPVYITLFAAYAWAMTARFNDVHNHPFTINFDFFLHTTYLWGGLLGILNTPSLDNYFSVLTSSTNAAECIGLVVATDNAKSGKAASQGKRASKFEKL